MIKKGPMGLECMSAELQETGNILLFWGGGSWLPECLLYKYSYPVNVYVQCFVHLLCFPPDISLTLSLIVTSSCTHHLRKKFKSLAGLLTGKVVAHPKCSLSLAVRMSAGISALGNGPTTFV